MSPSTKSPPANEPVYTDADAQALFGTPSPSPPLSSLSKLSLPVVFPQTATRFDSPFARGYNDHMRYSGIEMNDWLKFVDGLNIAMVRFF